MSGTWETAAAALDQARLVAEQSIRDVLIEADGREYAPADFKRLFVTSDAAEAGGRCDLARYKRCARTRTLLILPGQDLALSHREADLSTGPR